jgi:hypothetical protein
MTLSTAKTPKAQSLPRRQFSSVAATAPPTSMHQSHALIIDLQRTIGNRAVQRLLQRQQATSSEEVPQVSQAEQAEPQGVSLQEMQHIANTQPGYAAFGAPEAKTMGEVKGLHGGPMDAGSWVLGFTTIPSNYTVPSYMIDVKQGPAPWRHWFGTVIPFARADEGETKVYYVREGKYDTGKESRKMPIRAIVNSEMAKSARAAEMEHTADYTYAYRITLAAADNAIQQLAGRQFDTDYPEGGAMDRSIAEKDIERAVNKAFLSLVPRLGTDFSKWGAYYVNRFNRTGVRDERGWHTHGDGGLQASDGSELVYVVNKGRTKIDVDNPGSNSAEIVDWNSTL